MATIKAYTDIEQSKKLAEILPPESADMCWVIDDDIMKYGDKPYLNPYKNYIAKEYYIPCWSLASLVSILPVSCDDGQHCFALINCNPNGDTEWLCCYEDDNGNLLNECYADNPVDACVEMVLKLDEQKVLLWVI